MDEDSEKYITCYTIPFYPFAAECTGGDKV